MMNSEYNTNVHYPVYNVTFECHSSFALTVGMQTKAENGFISIKWTADH